MFSCPHSVGILNPHNLSIFIRSVIFASVCQKNKGTIDAEHPKTDKITHIMSSGLCSLRDNGKCRIQYFFSLLHCFWPTILQLLNLHLFLGKPNNAKQMFMLHLTQVPFPFSVSRSSHEWASSGLEPSLRMSCSLWLSHKLSPPLINRKPFSSPHT